ncbi:MAG: carboxypeptidase-like regulatory domain-containing protein [Gemmatimonadales bacterium]|nr:carboxypeptidase-like regulatory domain-containing protein [Gemmatimonadales bacterium]
MLSDVARPGVVLLLLSILVGGGQLPAQLVKGQVTVAATGAPLGGALVTLADSTGSVRARTVSGRTGAYALFAPGTGRWMLRVAAIGFAPETIADVEVGAVAAVRDVALTERPFELPELVTVSSGEACQVAPGTGPVVERLLAEAATALGLVEATIDSRRLEFVTESRQVRLGIGVGDTLRHAAINRSRAAWPLASADQETLKSGGFVHDAGTLAPAIGYSEESGPTYFGPDLQVLVAPWFLASHCFNLEPDLGGDSLVVRFTPRRSSNRVDLEGHLIIHRTDLTLRQLNFQYVGLPNWVPPQGAGGEVHFERLPNGLWITRAWLLRAPIENRRGALGERRGSSFGGWAELGGRVLEIVGGS